MFTRKPLTIVILFFLAVACLALVGGFLSKRNRQFSIGLGEGENLRCANDGSPIHRLYQVDAFGFDRTTNSFCSIYCASRWQEKKQTEVMYFTVVDEISGQKIDSTLAHFVESDLVTSKAVNNRIHAFFSERDALRHMHQFNGRVVENPFGRSLVLPKIAKLDNLKIAAPPWPDAFPLKLATLKPIFKENRLNVEVVPVQDVELGKKLLADGSVQGMICDVPTAVLLARAQPPARIIKNVLRANPYRPLFAIVSGPNGKIRNLEAVNKEPIAVPKGSSFRFYLDYYFQQENIPHETAVIRETEDIPTAWNMLVRGEIGAALLRTPYTDIAIKNRMTLVADDKNLPWTSVLVIRQSVIKDNSEILNRFLFGLEQAVLALNLMPDKYRALIIESGAIPDEARKHFPMPIFEGANAPSKEEIQPILRWLKEKGLIAAVPAYEDIVNTSFLPDPNNVGLAFCCR